jgi:hypothetical protein
MMGVGLQIPGGQRAECESIAIRSGHFGCCAAEREQLNTFSQVIHEHVVPLIMMLVACLGMIRSIISRAEFSTFLFPVGSRRGAGRAKASERTIRHDILRYLQTARDI